MLHRHGALQPQTEVGPFPAPPLGPRCAKASVAGNYTKQPIEPSRQPLLPSGPPWPSQCQGLLPFLFLLSPQHCPVSLASPFYLFFLSFSCQRQVSSAPALPIPAAQVLSPTWGSSWVDISTIANCLSKCFFQTHLELSSILTWLNTIFSILLGQGQRFFEDSCSFGIFPHWCALLGTRIQSVSITISSVSLAIGLLFIWDDLLYLSLYIKHKYFTTSRFIRNGLLLGNLSV